MDGLGEASARQPEGHHGVGRRSVATVSDPDLGLKRLGHPLDNYQLAARRLREATKDKSYRAYEMGQQAGVYLRWKRGMITASTYRDYEACLDKLARAFPDLTLTDFEPPVGTARLEEFLDERWGDSAARTYNKNVSVVKDFFKFHVLKGNLHGDPALPIVPHKKRDVHRESYNSQTVSRIVASGPLADRLFRDRVALRLLLVYGLRKGSLAAIQYKHFDHNRKRLTIFAKGGKVRELPIVESEFWSDLGRHIIEIEASPDHFLMAREKTIWRGYTDEGSKFERRQFPDKPMAAHGLHNWWYGCLERAGIVDAGITRGEKMHKARHTAGQRVLDKTGNLKATQRLLGHASIATTGDIYVDHDIMQLEATMREVVEDD